MLSGGTLGAKFYFCLNFGLQCKIPLLFVLEGLLVRNQTLLVFENHCVASLSLAFTSMRIPCQLL